MTTHRPLRSKPNRSPARPPKTTPVVRGRLSSRAPAKSAADTRIDVRLSKDTKQLLVRATELLGSNLTAFILESAQERAAAVIERYERLRLSDRDRDKLLAALDNPPAPTKKLLKALQASAPSTS